MSDLISRQDAIEAVEQAIFNHDSAIMRITELPSADRPTGEWQKEIKGNGWNEWAVLTCDQCGAVIKDPTFETNYCPNCGAKMGGDNDDAD